MRWAFFIILFHNLPLVFPQSHKPLKCGRICTRRIFILSSIISKFIELKTFNKSECKNVMIYKLHHHPVAVEWDMQPLMQCWEIGRTFSIFFSRILIFLRMIANNDRAEKKSSGKNNLKVLSVFLSLISSGRVGL